MALTNATVTFNVEDMTGVKFDARRTKVWVTTNVENDTVIDKGAKKIRLGSGDIKINEDGTGSATVWVPGPDANPRTWQTTFHVDYPDRNRREQRVQRHFGPFTITGNADLANLVDEQAVPPTYITQVTQQLDAKVAQATTAANNAATTAATAAAAAVAAEVAGETAAAQAARVAAESAAARARDISDIDSTDDAVDVALKLPGGKARATLTATIAGGVTQAATNVNMRGQLHNRRHLARWEDALRSGLAHIAVVGNSIAWGVGADDNGATTAGYYEPYRQYAWPVQLRKRFARERGQAPAENFIGLTSAWGYATLSGSAAPSQTIGPFGSMGSNTERGGISLPDSTATITIPSGRTGRFTDLDVFYWGTGSGVGGGFSPTVLVDGVTVHTGGVASTAGLTKVSITGLSDQGHEIKIVGTASNPTWIAYIAPRRSTGISINRIAVPGAKMTDVVGHDVWTTEQRTRQIDAAVMHGHANLVILSMTANDVYQQTPLATYEARAQTIINRVTGGGGCILLMGDPAVSNEETNYAIKGSQYRAVLKSLSDSNAHAAYADFNSVFGDRSRAFAAGMYPDAGTVHPSADGHKRMADFVYDLLPGPSV